MNKQPAYSLVFAFLIMTVIMIVASTSISGVTGKVRYFNEVEAASQARLAAESAADLAILQVKDVGLGYEASEDVALCLDSTGATISTSSGTVTRSDCVSSGGYEILGLAQANSTGETGHFYLPIPGTGNAAPSDECSLNLDDPEAVNHPCNWNKLLAGQSVTIPLYRTNGSGGFEVPASTDVNLTDWQLKVRTPCTTSGDYSTSCTRYEFDATMTDSSVSVAGDDPVILWTLNGEFIDGTTDSVIPEDQTTRSSGGRGSSSSGYTRDDLNTEISEGRINDAYLVEGDYEVFNVHSTMDTDDAYDLTIHPDLSALNLQLTAISQLLDDSANTIPYLEWQLVYEADEGLASEMSYMDVTGFYEVNGKTFIHNNVVSYNSSSDSFTIYAIAN